MLSPDNHEFSQQTHYRDSVWVSESLLVHLSTNGLQTKASWYAEKNLGQQVYITYVYYA